MVASPVDALSLKMWHLASRIVAICSSHGRQRIVKVLWETMLSASLGLP